MKWSDLLHIIGNEPLFNSSVLITGPVNSVDIGRQLSRWVSNGRLIQIRKGLYMLSDTYRKKTPHPFLVANTMKRASYISLQSALAHYGLIPEYVPSVTSVTTGRPETVSSSIGNYIFKHIKIALFYSYKKIELGEGQSAFVASPEKALLDLLYLTPGSNNLSYQKELRLQNLETLDLVQLTHLAQESKSQKLVRAIKNVMLLVQEQQA
jgi:predicted transcriptional regulator of viral defense system